MHTHIKNILDFPGGSDGNTGDPGLIPGLGRFLEEGNVYPLSILAWKIPWREEPGRLQSMGPQWVRHGWAADAFTNYGLSMIVMCHSMFISCNKCTLQRELLIIGVFGMCTGSICIWEIFVPSSQVWYKLKTAETNLLWGKKCIESYCDNYRHHLSIQ